MPKKLDPDSKRSTKILKLYSLLLRNDKEYSTAELMEYLKCSKQTIRGIVDDLNESGLISVEERKVHNKNVFRIEHCRPGIYEPIALEGFRQMEMCRDILGSMLPKEDFESLNRAIFEAQNYLPRHERSNFKTFSVAVGFTKGYIDYSKFKDILHNLYKCIMENKCCYIEHSRLINTQTKRHMFAPKRVKCYRETFYITGWIIDESQSEIKAKYDNPAMFSIHRIKNVQIIEDKSSSALPPVSVEKKNSYGIISDSEPFKVTLRFTEDYAIT